jgi:GNAT superfamily N-acetyltransferase
VVHVRRAELKDIPVIARHRAGMFTDMGILPAAERDALIALTKDYLRTALPAEEYLGWMAAPDDAPETVIGGAGVQRRRVLPFPSGNGAASRIATGRQAIVLNVYTEPGWRRRGVARTLMQTVLAWAREAGVESLVLHASDQGRALYEQLGFAATNEMRYQGP